MNNKTLAIISYVTIIGWLVTYFSIKDQNPKSSLVVYHLKQSLGIIIIQILLSIIINVVSNIVPSIAGILSLAYFVPLVLWVLGIINAANEKEAALPLIGKMFEDKFAFIG